MGDKGIVHNRNCPLAVDKKYIKDKKDDKSQQIQLLTSLFKQYIMKIGCEMQSLNVKRQQRIQLGGALCHRKVYNSRANINCLAFI